MAEAPPRRTGGVRAAGPLAERALGPRGRRS
jgi:hypothetical protein